MLYVSQYPQKPYQRERKEDADHDDRDCRYDEKDVHFLEPRHALIVTAVGLKLREVISF